MKTINLNCDNCNIEIIRNIKHHNRNILRGTINTFCSLTCNAEFKSKNAIPQEVEIFCNYCKKTTLKKKSIVKKSKSNLRYCNRICLAQSKIKVKSMCKKQSKSCSICNTNISGKNKYCELCKSQKIPSSYNCTKKEMFDKCKNWQSARTQIRKHAKLIFNNYIKTNKCSICNYSKHIEICHIKPVKDFSDNCLLSQINNPNNLVALCPNHHWEFDNGFLILEAPETNAVSDI